MHPAVAPSVAHVTRDGAVHALAVVGLGWLAARLLRLLVQRAVRWRGRSASAAVVYGRVAGWLVLGLAIGAALTVVFPSVRPVDVLGSLGIVSVAAGIAFQTVLGNMFAGIVLVTRDAYGVGDQVAVGDHKGQIERIDLTATTLRTFDGRLLVIPNSEMHSRVVSVQTGYADVRTSVAVSLDRRADVDRAREVAVAAMRSLPTVHDEPAPDALLAGIGRSTVRLELRFWSGAHQLETRAARHDVIRSVLRAFEDEGVAMGSHVLVVERRDDSSDGPGDGGCGQPSARCERADPAVAPEPGA